MGHVRIKPLHYKSTLATYQHEVDLFFSLRRGHACSSHLQPTRVAQETNKDSRGNAEISGGVAPPVTMATSVIKHDLMQHI